MRIDSASLRTGKLEELKRFYTGPLGLPLAEEEADAFAVSAGPATLRFSRCGRELRPYYHAAFHIAAGRAGEAAGSLAAAGIEPYRFPDGSHTAYSRSWHAASVYFRDPAGNILELIAHADGPWTNAAGAGPHGIASLAEIGLPVADVRGTAAALNEAFGLGVHRDDGDERFAAIGDEEGMLILSRVGRIWVGSDREARVFPTAVKLAGVRAGEWSADGIPYRVSAAWQG